jgi:tetratricopeptide (TPR) repeat protein
MFKAGRLCFGLTLALISMHGAAPRGRAQTDAANPYHQIEGRIHSRAARVSGLRVRLLRMPDLRPVGETFCRPEGQFTFSQLTEGDYVVETFETETFEATATNVQVRPLDRRRPTTVNVLIDLPLRPPPERHAPGVVVADVDLEVPKPALKHFRAGLKALEEGDSLRAIAELRAAIERYPKYYAAHLELGRELRLRKRYAEAEPVILSLREIAPRKAEPHIEYGIVLLSLERREKAVEEFEAALRLEETNWAAHLFLGWALLEKEPEKAEIHFQRALKLDEQKAARAHLALARLADAKGLRELAIQHLDTYLALAPDAHDAEAARKLAERLRSPERVPQ